LPVATAGRTQRVEIWTGAVCFFAMVASLLPGIRAMACLAPATCRSGRQLFQLNVDRQTGAVTRRARVWPTARANRSCRGGGGTGSP
jgi:hypothetical protein